MRETLDAIDLEILKILQKNARISNLELSEKVGLSPSPCSRRVKQLEQTKTIQRYATVVNQALVGLPVSVFVNVTLDKQVRENLEIFENAVQQYPEVMECYLMTGDADYLLRVVVPNLDAYHKFLLDRLTKIPCVANIKSSFSLKQVSYRTELPLHLDTQGK